MLFGIWGNISGRRICKFSNWRKKAMPMHTPATLPTRSIQFWHGAFLAHYNYLYALFIVLSIVLVDLCICLWCFCNEDFMRKVRRLGLASHFGCKGARAVRNIMRKCSTRIQKIWLPLAHPAKDWVKYVFSHTLQAPLLYRIGLHLALTGADGFKISGARLGMAQELADV